MKLTITLDLGNDAIRTPHEALNAIRRAFVTDLNAHEPVDQQVTPIEGKLRDANGNSVGSYVFSRALTCKRCSAPLTGGPSTLEHDHKLCASCARKTPGDLG